MITVVLVGAGDRGMIYARLASEKPERFRIVAVVEPDAVRRERAQFAFGLPGDRLFPSVDALCRLPRLADAAFNCTMDQAHLVTSLPLLRKGYHLLLEKPLAPTREDARMILDCAECSDRRVMICHVLRYAPFYERIKELISSGVLGRVTSLQMSEDVSYYHQSVSYVRGKFGDPDICGSGMLLSKCSHDLDIMAWLMQDAKPLRVFSEGGNSIFCSENAPESAAERCLPDCPRLNDCSYSAKTLYADHPQRWAARVYNDSGLSSSSVEDVAAALAEPDNPYGRCVFRIKPKIVDHQSVLVRFEGGVTGTFSMNGGAARSSRSIRIIGTKGMIEGRFEDGRFSLRHIDPAAPGGYADEVFDLSALQAGDAHGGGDARILDDFYRLLSGQDVSICCTSLADSLAGHEIAYAAELSRKSGLPENVCL